MSAANELAAALDGRLLERQRACRAPSLAAAVVRGGAVLWQGAVGLADCERSLAAQVETQYRIGSITKVLTALAVAVLADEGRLALGDRLDVHLPGIAYGTLRLDELLAHVSGLQREAGDMFVSGTAPSSAEILAGLERYEQVLPPARAYHYSNLAYALLGEAVAAASGTSYGTFVEQRLLAPLGLERTTWVEQPPSARGYLVDEYAGTVAPEPQIELDGVRAMGQLWSTVADLGRLASFLAGDGAGLVDPSSLEQMWTPRVIVDRDHWTLAWGLGLELDRHDGRIFGGHGGAMPGFLAGLHVERSTGVGAVVLANAGTRVPTREICLELAGVVLEQPAAAPSPWRPEPVPPAEVAAILGRWWSEGREFVFAWREGRLVAEVFGAPAWVQASVFEPLPDGGYRAVAGRERGERLAVEGDRLVFAGYPFTRQQRTSPG